jgi:hypothetical protein
MNIIKFFISIVCLFTVYFSIYAKSEKDTLILYPAPASNLKTFDFEVKVNNIPIDLYGSRTRYGNISSFGYFDFKGKVTVSVKALYPSSQSSWLTILPLRLNIQTKKIQNGHIEFELTEPQKLTIILDGDYTGSVLNLFANALDSIIPSPYDTNTIYFGPGYYKIGKDKKQTLTLTDNKTLYIAGGAYVEGMVYASKSKHIKICGHGILAQPASESIARGIRIDDCSDIHINGIILNRQNGGWTTNIVRCNNIKIEDYKGISTAIWSSDGIDLVNCQNVTINDCFIRAGDDEISIKGLGQHFSWKSEQDPKETLPNENIFISGVTAWSDNNNAFVVGQETIAKYYKNIHFKNCDVLFVHDDQDIKSAMSVICMHGTDMSDISYEDITVGPCGYLISVFYTDDIFSIKGNLSWNGKMNNILYKNITTFESGSKSIRIDGFSESKPVQNIELNNIQIRGEKLNKQSPYLKINKNVKSLTIK